MLSDMHYIHLKHQTVAFNDTILKIIFDMVPQTRYNSGIRKWI